MHFGAESLEEENGQRRVWKTVSARAEEPQGHTSHVGHPEVDLRVKVHARTHAAFWKLTEASEQWAWSVRRVVSTVHLTSFPAA